MSDTRTEMATNYRALNHKDGNEQDDVLELTVVLPVYQERDVIWGTVTDLLETLNGSGLKSEVIAVDDGSTDGTHEVLQELKSLFPDHLRIVRHPYNKGNGAAIKTGIRAACGKVIACMDADGQHDPKDLLHMLPWIPEYDMVIGARTGSYRGPWHRNLANKLYNAIASWLTHFRIDDLTSGYRLFRASIIRQYVHLFPARFSYPTTSTLAFIKGEHNVKFVPINILARRGDNSKIRLMHDGWRFLVIIFKIIVIFEPLRVFLPTALVLLLLAIASTAYSMWNLGRLHIPNSGVILFVVSVLIVLLGLIAEQIAAIQVSTKSVRND